jgi:transposase, IS30 family
MQTEWYKKGKLTQNERVEIYAFLKQNLSYREIWRRLWRHHTTIWREVLRNGIDKWRWIIIYDPLEAEKRRLQRRHKANQNHVILRRDTKQRELLEKLLKEKWRSWGPDEILWRVELELWRKVVSTPTFYRFMREKSPILQRYLRYKQKGYRTTKKWNKRKKMYDDVPNICERPEIITVRWRLGDFEWDTIVSWKKYSWWLVSLADRKSRYYLIKKVGNLKANTINQTIKAMLMWEKVESITFDNWVEFSSILELPHQCYRADAYSSWQRWTNEKHNWYLRRFIPKWVNIDNRSNEEIQNIQNMINHKPRKILGYRTPYEVYYNKTLSYIK